MTNQEIFDKVAKHLLTQNAQSLNHNKSKGFRCAYRSDNGQKCAIGCLITDEAYHDDLEGLGPLSGQLRLALVESGVSYEKMDSTCKLLIDLQLVHDNLDPAEWPEELSLIAERYNLTWNYNET